MRYRFLFFVFCEEAGRGVKESGLDFGGFVFCAGSAN